MNGLEKKYIWYFTQGGVGPPIGFPVTNPTKGSLKQTHKQNNHSWPEAWRCDSPQQSSCEARCLRIGYSLFGEDHFYRGSHQKKGKQGATEQLRVPTQNDCWLVWLLFNTTATSVPSTKRHTHIAPRDGWKTATSRSRKLDAMNILQNSGTRVSHVGPTKNIAKRAHVKTT